VKGSETHLVSGGEVGLRLAPPARKDGGLNRLAAWCSQPVDPGSVVVFRIVFGLCMAGWAADYLLTGRVRFHCEVPAFHFTYPGFGWVVPWPGGIMVAQFAAMLIAALLIAAGAFWRLATLTFAIGFTHFFLIDRTHYQNHYYLILLLSWMLVLIPANHCFAVDVVLRRVPHIRTMPQWALRLLQFQIAVPYVFGGIAKLDADWLTSLPMYHMLLSQADRLEALGWTTLPADAEWLASLLTWGGLAFDLLIVPALCWRVTRWPAFVILIGFHVANSVLFSIHVFPWLMIAASTIFWPADWPRRWFMRKAPIPLNNEASPRPISRPAVVAMGAFVMFQLVFPLRHHLYPGPAGWTEQGHYFAWRMMLRGKTSGVRFYITDPQTGRTGIADIRPFLNPEQLGKFARDPEMILDLSRHLARQFQQSTGRWPQVHALVLTSLNGRRPQLLVDPNRDLAAEPPFAFRRDWIMPLTEPLTRDPWTVPLAAWESCLELPRLSFIQ
jgi:hypothetical protein